MLVSFYTPKCFFVLVSGTDTDKGNMAGVVARDIRAPTPRANPGATVVQPKGDKRRRAQSRDLCEAEIEIARAINQVRAGRPVRRDRASVAGRRARYQRAMSLLDDTHEGKHNLPHNTRGFLRRVGFEDPEEVAQCSMVCISPSHCDYFGDLSDEEGSDSSCQSDCTVVSL